QLVAIADAGDAVLVPAVHARARLVVREVVPRGAVGAVVLAHRAPGALGEVGPPALPVRLAIASLGEPAFFVGHAAVYAPRAARVTRARTSSTVSAAGSATTVASAPNRARQGSSTPPSSTTTAPPPRSRRRTRSGRRAKRSTEGTATTRAGTPSARSTATARATSVPVATTVTPGPS